MPTVIRRLLAAATVVALAAAALAAQEAPLRYRWVKGDVAKYRLTQETVAAMSGIPGMGEMTVTTNLQQMQTITATEVGADGAATLELKYDAVKLDMNTPMGGAAYDSASPTPPADPIAQQMAPMLGAIIGEFITMVVEPDGAVRSLTGANKIKEKMNAKMPPGASAAGMGMNPAGGLDAMFSDEAMKGSLGQSMAMLPKNAVKVGETWKTETKVPGPAGEMLFANVFTLAAMETLDGRQVARINIKQDIRPNGNATPAGPMSIKMEQGSGTGEMLFDVKLGRVVKTTNSATLPMSMTMTMPDGQTMSLTANTRTKTVYEAVK